MTRIERAEPASTSLIAEPSFEVLTDCLDRLWRSCQREADLEMDQLAGAIWEDFSRLSRDLDKLLTVEVRQDLLGLLKWFDENKDELAPRLIAWIDLVEEICLEVEKTYGSHTGPLKFDRVRGAIFQLAQAFLGDVALPSVPSFFRPFIIDILCRVSVEFVILLVNTPAPEHSLWRSAVSAEPDRRASTTQRALSWFARRCRSLFEALAAWLVNPSPLPAKLQKQIDTIIAQWDAESEQTGRPPVANVVQSVFGFLAWIGQHGREMRLAVNTLSVTVRWAFEFSDLTDDERIALIKRALLRYLEEAGLSGTLFQRICEIALDLSVDATVELMRKRLALSEMAASG